MGVKDGRIVMPRGLVKDQKVNVLFEVLMLHSEEIDDFDRLPVPSGPSPQTLRPARWLC